MLVAKVRCSRAFYFISREGTTPIKEYEEFVERAKPDWCPIPQDFIPTPKMDWDDQERCFIRTMEMNTDYQDYSDRFFPVIHVSQLLEEYVETIQQHPALLTKSRLVAGVPLPNLALGGIVPNLLRAPKAMSHQKLLTNLQHVLSELEDRKLHVFGIGGTSTLHVAALLGVYSVDSSGWRNRAARGIVQLPGTGERIVAELSSWRGRRLSQKELEKLKECQCPACQMYGLDGLKMSK